MKDDTQRVTVLYFAWLRDRMGVAQEQMELPASVETVGALLEWIAARSPRHRAAFENRAVVRCAVNQDFADASAPVRAGDEVAFFPPVTGG
jgi:sulfur-carrier protein